MEVADVFVGQEHTPTSTFLHEFGFVNIVKANGRVKAVAPCPTSDSAIVLETKADEKRGYLPFRLIRILDLKDGRMSEIDKGLVTLTLPPSIVEGKKRWEVMLDGREIGSWDIIVKETDISLEQLSRVAEACASADAVGYSSPTRLFVRVPRWRTNEKIIAFIKANCGGDTSMEAFATAVKKRSDDLGKTVNFLAGELYENTSTVMAIMQVLNLHPKLRALPDLPESNPLRMTLPEMKVLVRFPTDIQIEVWEIARHEKDHRKVMEKLYEIAEKGKDGVPYFKRIFYKTR